MIHSDLLLEIANAFDLSLLHPTNPASTRYSDNNNNSNLVINLMFLRYNSLELNNHSILPELWYLSDHTSLVVEIHISKEFFQNKRYSIIKNSDEEMKYIFEIIKNFKKVDTLHLMNKESLEFVVQEFATILDHMWQKHSKWVKTTKQLKYWWNKECQVNLSNYRSSRWIEI